jgi:starvation-inducible DNA-binding protein
MNTNIGLTEKSRAKVIKLLQSLLADNLLLELKTRNAHWNVTGPHFNHLHLMFGGQYEELAESSDEIAERIRKLGGNPIATLKEASSFARLKEAPGKLPEAPEWIEILLKDHESVIRQLREDAETASKQDDAGTNDFLIGLLKEHEKTAWMLRASLKD